MALSDMQVNCCTHQSITPHSNACVLDLISLAMSAGPARSDAARRHAEQQRILYQRGQQGGAFERVAPSKGESRRWERSGQFQKRVRTAILTQAVYVHF